MLKRDITYTNLFTDQEVTETHYFHISKTDLVEMEIEEHGQAYSKDGEEFTGMRAKLQRIVDSEDGKAIMAEIKDMIRRSYGKKDGDRFVKSQEAWDDFSGSEAFSQLLFELCTTPDATAEFMNGVIPGNLDQIAQGIQEQAEKISAGREAQEKAKATAAAAKAATPETALAEAAPKAEAAGLDTSAVVEGQLSDGAVAAMDALSHDAEKTLAERIDAATAENPVVLTEADVASIDSDTLKSGLATGRIKIS